MPSRCGHWALLGVMGALENQMWQTSGVIKPPESAMHTSHFQLGLIAALAVGLGFSLASTDAVGYPASAVSYGESPVVSMAEPFALTTSAYVKPFSALLCTTRPSAKISSSGFVFSALPACSMSSALAFMMPS